MGFAQKNLGFDRPPKLFFKQDSENAKDFFGKTAHYDPRSESVTVFVTDRHPKDIMRSLAHELVHHVQNLRGDLSPEKCGDLGPGYAQTNKHMREMERQAFEKGNLCFRDFCDQYKKQQQEVKFLKESKKMANKLTKNKLKGLIRNVLKEIKLNEQVSYEEDEAGMSLPGQYTFAGALPGDPDPAPRLPSRYLDPEDPGYTAGYSEEDPNVDMRGELSDEAAAKALQQKRFVRRLGLRNMSRLQKMVGAVETGEYDDQTMLAIKRLQKKLGFSLDGQDGVFGPATMRRFKRMKARRRTRKPSIKGIRTAVDAATSSLPSDTEDRMQALSRSLEESNNIDEMGCGGAGPKGDKDLDEEDYETGSRKIGRRKVLEDEAEIAERQARKADRDPSSKGNTKMAQQQQDRGMKVRPVTEGEGKSEKCKKCLNCGCKGAGCHECDNCKDCNPVKTKKVSEQMTSPDAPMSVDVKPDFPDVDGDGDTKEPISQAQKQKKEKEGDDPKKKSAKPKKGEVPPQLRKHVEKNKKGQNESKIYTPEQEQSLYESRFSNRNQQIFDKLKKLWTK